MDKSTGVYQARTGKEYQFTIDGCDWDLDHPDACLFTFTVTGPSRSFEKVIPVDRQEIAGAAPGDVMAAAQQVAQARLFRKLDEGNEADEPTPLR